MLKLYTAISITLLSLLLSSCGDDISNLSSNEELNSSENGSNSEGESLTSNEPTEPPLFENSSSNNPPVAFFFMDRYRYSDEVSITFDGSHSIDRDSDITTYIWKSNLDGELSRKEIFSTDSLSVGQHKITLLIYDSKGNSANFYKQIEVYTPVETVESTNQSGNFVRPSLLSRNGESTVKDSVTGLIWSDSDEVYGSFSDAELYCSNLELDGINSWRVPTIKELWYISQSVDSDVWNNISDVKYWSSTSVLFFGDESNNRVVDFATGDEKWAIRDYRYSMVYTRCVSGDFGFKLDLERDSADGVVMDSRTYLMWQDTNQMEHLYSEEAEGYCNGLVLAKYSNWRLPTARELYSILDHSSEYDPLTYNYFHNGDSGFYFTSSEREDGSLWSIDFSTGKSGSTEFGSVRCVRGL